MTYASLVDALARGETTGPAAAPSTIVPAADADRPAPLIEPLPWSPLSKAQCLMVAIALYRTLKIRDSGTETLP